MDLTPEQDRLVKECKKQAADIAEHRRLISVLSAERRNSARQLFDLIGDLAGTAQALEITRQTLAGILKLPRRPAGPALRPLVEAGLLEPGNLLCILRREPPPLEASVDETGRILVGEIGEAEPFDTPSAAAKKLSGRANAAWTRFRVPSQRWATLADLRDILKSQEASGS
jgi:hypothetical protein